MTYTVRYLVKCKYVTLRTQDSTIWPDVLEGDVDGDNAGRKAGQVLHHPLYQTQHAARPREARVEPFDKRAQAAREQWPRLCRLKAGPTEERGGRTEAQPLAVGQQARRVVKHGGRVHQAVVQADEADKVVADLVQVGEDVAQEAAGGGHQVGGRGAVEQRVAEVAEVDAARKA